LAVKMVIVRGGGGGSSTSTFFDDAAWKAMKKHVPEHAAFDAL
jgi:hypothetical protein